MPRCRPVGTAVILMMIASTAALAQPGGGSLFHSFFDITDLNLPHPTVRVDPAFFGVFEDNDPRGRMMALVCYNSDVAEYWEWSGRGLFPVDTTNDAYKIGINFIIYALTH